MADFRRWILALTVLALCVTGGFAQVGTPTGTTPTALGVPFSCTATNSAVVPTIRQEGLTEMVGDIVINCIGGNNFAIGAAIPTATITVYVGGVTTVTSRLLGSGGVSEAVLLIDEPNTGLSGTGPSTAMTVCPNPLTGGCPAVVGTSGNPVNSGTQTPAYNVYQGVVDPNTSKYVTFYGVPVMPPVTAGFTRVYRITNVRANANNVPASPGNPGQLNALISISGSSYVPLANSSLVVAYVQPGLTPSLRNTGNSGGISNTFASAVRAVTLESCDSAATSRRRSRLACWQRQAIAGRALPLLPSRSPAASTTAPVNPDSSSTVSVPVLVSAAARTPRSWAETAIRPVSRTSVLVCRRRLTCRRASVSRFPRST